METDPCRCNTRGLTVVAGAMATRMAFVALCFAALPAATGTLGTPSGIQFVVIGTALLTLLMATTGAIGIISDYRLKSALGARYSLVVRYGIDSFQARNIRVRGPVVDLVTSIIDVLRTIAPSSDIRATDARTVQCKRPAEDGAPASTILVTINSEDTESRIHVESISSGTGLIRRRPVRTDGGRSIVNVEEFQTALKRRLESSR